MNEYFVTSDNRKIKLFPEWFSPPGKYEEICNKYHKWVQQVFVDSLKTGHTGVSYKLFPLEDIFMGKAVEAGYTIDYLKALKLPTKYHSVLDIGSATAVQPRIMKMSGYVDEVCALDRSYQKDVITDNEIKTWTKRMQKNTRPSKLKQLGNYLFHARMFNTDGSPSIDNFITDDFVAHKFDRKFDLITAYHFFCYGDPVLGIPKVAELLNDGGVLVVLVNNWYDVDGGSAELPMAAPWLHTRVNREDLYRYYKENHPEIYEDIKLSIHRPRINVTPRDYIEFTQGTGLSLIEIKYSNITYIEQSLIDTNVIMDDVNIINPNAVFDDLCYYFITMIFRKE